MKTWWLAAAFAVCAATANAAVIPGPVLANSVHGWAASGLHFRAFRDTTLMGFTFQNEGLADTIILTDDLGNVLHSVNTPAGMATDPVTVSWALQQSQQYWLIQTTADNAKWEFWGVPLPLNSDIGLLMSGSFGHSVAGVLGNDGGFSSTQLWAAFNDITTGVAPVPEPATLALFGVALAGLGAVRRRKK